MSKLIDVTSDENGVTVVIQTEGGKLVLDLSEDGVRVEAQDIGTKLEIEEVSEYAVFLNVRRFDENKS